MALYPSLEDMKVDQLMKAQVFHENAQRAAANVSVPFEVAQEVSASAPYPVTPTSVQAPAERYAHLYPMLDDYMGLQLVDPEVALVHAQSNYSVACRSPDQMIAPLSGNSVGLKRAQVSHGIREVLLCKDQNGKVGMRLQALNKGIFVILVQKNTPASLAGLRFGDQILMINDVVVAGFSRDKVHDIIKKSNPQKITMVIRDRPFERTVTVHKDSLGHVGFEFKNGKIIKLVQDSSAARNGLLIDHHLLEVDGQNVVTLPDKEAKEIFKAAGKTITVTVMPSFIFEHLIKCTASSFLKKTMDHSIPDI